MTRHYNYSEINLVPNLCVVDSRSDCSTSLQFANRKWELPVIPANMSCTIDMKLALELESKGYFYILHRFYEYKDILEWISNNQERYLSISVGIKSADEGLIKTILDRGLKIDCVTVDIAHGFSQSVGKMIQYIKQNLPSTFVIAGNVATPEAVTYLESMGADAVKIGVGPGRVCSTARETGFSTSGMFTTIQDCAKVANVPLIADGGIRHNGDIAKALVAGADMVMVGSMFAELSNSPAETIYNYKHQFVAHGENKPHIIRTDPKSKTYYGSASSNQKGSDKHVEGIKVEMKYNPLTYEEKLNEIKQSIQSSISYSGGCDLNAFNNVKYNYNC